MCCKISYKAKMTEDINYLCIHIHHNLYGKRNDDCTIILLLKLKMTIKQNSVRHKKLVTKEKNFDNMFGSI